MHSKQYREHLRSPRWRLVRRAALSRAGYKCEICGTTGRLEVHHKTYENLGHETLDDVIVTCPRCHEKADRDRRIETSDRRWWARVDGWASKRYGERWEEFYAPELVEEEFEEWLEEIEEYEEEYENDAY